MTTKVVSSTAFEALLGDLQTLAKATDVNQERIAAGRAAEGHMQHGEGMAKSEAEKAAAKKKEEEEEAERKKKAGNAGGKEHMAKSFTIQTEGGGTIEVMDATEMLKSFGVRLDETTASVQQTFASMIEVVKDQGLCVKSLTEKLELQSTTIESQATLIKSLQDTVEKLGSAGAGRRAVVTVAERQTNTSTEVMAKAGMPEGVSTDDFFAKALTMQLKGEITGVDISLAEACLNSGRPVPENIVRRVLGSTAKAN